MAMLQNAMVRLILFPSLVAFLQVFGQPGQECSASDDDGTGLLQIRDTTSDGQLAAGVRAGQGELAGQAVRTFEIVNDEFVKDGQAFKILSGSLHYPRIPREYWRDRLQRIKALGLNTVTAYAFWNFHEEREGEFDWTGQRDIVEFFKIAGEEGLLVLFRPGPYICGEWDLGGLPWWLLPKPGMKLRTWNSEYIKYVDRFWDELLPKIKPLLYSNGGPVAIVQIENEYGSYGDCEDNPDDAKYMRHLLDVAVAHLGKDVVYTTIDGGEGASPASLGKGSPWKNNASVCATVDGGLSHNSSDYQKGFDRQKSFNAPGNSPKMWSELWTGWFSYWGHAAANKTANDFYKGLEAMVNLSASFSIYMALGGTNFATWSGANQLAWDSWAMSYQPDITSYEYSAPIGEQGRANIGADGSDLFAATQKAITAGGLLLELPAPIPRVGYGNISLTEFTSLFHNLASLQTCNQTLKTGEQVPTMEALGVGNGFVLFKEVNSPNANDARTMWWDQYDVRDRVQVFVDEKEVGSVYRTTQTYFSKVDLPAGKSLELLVENMGHINYGPNIDEQKGIQGFKAPGGDWSAICLPLGYAQVGSLPFASSATGSGPMFMRGSLEIAGAPKDTYIDSRGFHKGYIWVNGNMIGRYWEDRGPQHTLYLPAPFLRTGANEVIVFELEAWRDPPYATVISSVEWPRWQPVDTSGII